MDSGLAGTFKKDYEESQVFPLCSNTYYTITIRSISLDSFAVVSSDIKTTRRQQVSEDWITWNKNSCLSMPYGDLEEQCEAFRETLYQGLHGKDDLHKDDLGHEFFDISVRYKGDGVTKEHLGSRTFGRTGPQFFAIAN